MLTFTNYEFSRGPCFVWIPPGTYYVGDPCYVLPEEALQAIRNRQDAEKAWYWDQQFLIESDGDGVAFEWCTRRGDGIFDSSLGELGVDSGSLGVIDKRWVEPGKPDGIARDLSGWVTLRRRSQLRIDANGCAASAFLKVTVPS